MKILLEIEDVKQIIAQHYKIPIEDVEVDEDNLFDINITTCKATDILIPKIK